MTSTPSPTVPVVSTLTKSPTETPIAEEVKLVHTLKGLITLDELSSFSENTGISDWEIKDNLLSEDRACRVYFGWSWSSSQNQVYNCVFITSSDLNIDGAIEFLFSTWLYEDEYALESSLSFKGDHALFTGQSPNGHSVYDLIVLDKGFLYWASVSFGTSITISGGDQGAEEIFYGENQEYIDPFLENLILTNMEKIRLIEAP